ncbi:MAG TPA: hypothetical protein VFV50_11670, partial [Bdellovibrionales bacterium]|nr:hypothetical protein [Bdellovibrionales bacterium]
MSKNLMKVMAVVALTGLVSACSSNSGGGSAAPVANRDTTTAPESTEVAAGFSASHSGNFDIVGWAGNSLTDVMSAEDLHARVADFEGLVLAIDTFGTMGMADGRRYEYDRNARILRLYAAGHSLEVRGDGSTLSQDSMDAGEGDQGQGQVTKEAPLNLNCRLFEEEIKEEVKEQEQGGKFEEKTEQGQDTEKAPLEQ